MSDFSQSWGQAGETPRTGLMGGSSNLRYQTLNISGVGADQTDYVLRLDVHRGAQLFDNSGRDVFASCRTDFSDLRFFANGVELDHYLANHGNYELVVSSSRMGRDSVILSNGNIVSSGSGVGARVYESADDGLTWTEIYNATANVRFVDSRDYVYIVASNNLYRGIKSGETWTWNEALASGLAQFDILPGGMDEDTSGNLYFGRYQLDAATTAVIYKSTDQGASFSSLYTDTTRYHVHALTVGPDDTIYASIADEGTSATTSIVIKSVDGGANWTTYSTAIGEPTYIYCGDGYKLFAGGENGPRAAGTGIWKTTDDTTFTPVLRTNHTVQGLQKISGALYAFATPLYKGRYQQLYRSADDGDTWETVWIGDYNVTDFAGFGQHWYAGGTSSSMALIGSSITAASPARLYVGGDHYQATVYVKIPTLPAAGMQITAQWGGADKISTIDAFGDYTPSGLIARWKLNDGSGTSVVDALGVYTGTLTPGTGAWVATDGRKFGARYPSLGKTGAYFNFAGDGQIIFPTSGTAAAFQALVKNFAVVAWVYLPTLTGFEIVCGKGNGNSAWGLVINNSGAISNLGWLTSNGVGTNNVYVSSDPNAGNAYLMADGVWHMVAAVLDNSTPAKVSFFIDGRMFAPLSLPYDYSPADPNRHISIGGSPTDTLRFTGGIDDVRIYDHPLTELELRGIYENRPVAATEANVT
jgi:hypothetical protein